MSNGINASADLRSKASQHFSLAFEGQLEGNGFSIQDNAQGITLQIKDINGKSISSSMLLEQGAVSVSELKLNCLIALVGNGKALKAGSYHVTIKINIQHF